MRYGVPLLEEYAVDVLYVVNRPLREIAPVQSYGVYASIGYGVAGCLDVGGNVFAYK